MNRSQLTFEVARWEFTRFYKIKNELKAAAYMIVIGIIAFTISYLMGRGADDKPVLVVINEEIIAIDSTIYDHFQVQYATIEDIDSVKTLVGDGEVDGLTVIRSLDEGELYILNERVWMLQLEKLLTDFRRQTIIAQSDIPDEILDSILQSFGMETLFYDEEAAEGRGVERAFAIGFIIAMLAAIFIGFGYQFTAITGEKQQRITEQIVSAISPQTWIDGKILGITGIGLATILFYGVLLILGGLFISHIFGPGFLAPLAQVSIWKILAFVILSLLGIFLWNSFFAAIAATISDPNTSERSAFMLLPIVPVGFAFGALINPDSLIIKILGVFPLTSSSMLPARMMLTEVHVWEFFLAVVLLLAAVLLFRKAAAKIFSFGMLMYGKEPGLSEMWRWVKES
jgi:ABC-2 type transport system permease protein